MKVEQLPQKQISTFPDESILEAYRVTTTERIDLIPVVDREVPTKVIGVLTSEGVKSAYEKARNLR